MLRCPPRRNVPRQTFRDVQEVLFPRYFQLSLVCIALQFALAPQARHACAAAPRSAPGEREPSLARRPCLPAASRRAAIRRRSPQVFASFGQQQMIVLGVSLVSTLLNLFWLEPETTKARSASRFHHALPRKLRRLSWRRARSASSLIALSVWRVLRVATATTLG